jgi:hypothetical protein
VVAGRRRLGGGRVLGLRNPTVAHDERIRTLLPRDLIPFDDAAREPLAER